MCQSFPSFATAINIYELVDPEYLEFLEFLAKPVENLPSAEIQLERKEAERAGQQINYLDGSLFPHKVEENGQIHFETEIFS